ncbi:MAG: hypothetical protein ACTS6P_00950 [Candidatus Hodgkinia cicadicola]
MVYVSANISNNFQRSLRTGYFESKVHTTSQFFTFTSRSSFSRREFRSSSEGLTYPFKRPRKFGTV